jgi:hypothetical protein
MTQNAQSHGPERSRKITDGLRLPSKGRRQCENAEYIGITKPETPPAWVPEIRPPNPDETPIPVAPRAVGGLRIGFVTGALIAAIGLG